MKKSTLYTHAFTLFETIIAMFIATITIGIFYWIFTYIQKRHAVFVSDRGNITSILLFKRALTDDIQNCSFIYSPDELTEYWFIYPDDTVVYNLYPTVKISKGNTIDTTNVITKNISAEYLSIHTGGKVVKNIYLSIVKPVEIKNISFKKHYSSEQLINVRF